MCVLLFDVFKHILLRKTDVLKTCQKSTFFGKKICRNALALKSKKVQGIIGYNWYKRLFWHYSLQLSFIYKACFRFLLNCFVGEIKGFYQCSLGIEVDFRDIMNVKISWLKIKISKN